MSGSASPTNEDTTGAAATAHSAAGEAGRPHPRRRRRKYVTAVFSVLFVAGLAGFVYLGMWQGDSAQRQDAQQLRRDIAQAVRVLGQPEQESRERAAQWLVALGEPAVPAVIEALGHEDANVRDAAVHVLRAIGEPAIPALRELVEDPDGAGSRSRALHVLCGMGRPAAHTVAQWLYPGASEPPQPRAVLAALLAHGTSAPLDREPLLTASSERGNAAEPVLVYALLRVWSNEAAGVSAAKAEHALAEVSVAAILFAAAALPDIAATARRYVHKVRATAAVHPLIALLHKDEPPALHEHVTHLLPQLDPAAAVPALANALRSGGSHVKARRAAASILAQQQRPDQQDEPFRVAALGEALTDPDAKVRATAASALTRWAQHSPAAMHNLAAATWHWPLNEAEFELAHTTLQTALAPQAEALATGTPTLCFVAALAGFVHGWERATVEEAEEEAARLDALVVTLRTLTAAHEPQQEDGGAAFSVACARLLAATRASELRVTPGETEQADVDDTHETATWAQMWNAARVAALRLLEHLAQQEARAVAPAAVVALATALQTATEPPRQLRLRVLRVLAELGPGAAEALPAVDALRLSPRPELQEAAEATWRAILASDYDDENGATLASAPATVWLNRLDPLQETYAEDAEVRAQAAWHLQELDAERVDALKHDAEQHTRLLAALADEDERVRRRVGVVFVRLGDAALPVLVAALVDPHGDAPAAVDATLLALYDAGANVRALASEALLTAHANGDVVAPRLKELIAYVGLTPDASTHLLRDAATAEQQQPRHHQQQYHRIALQQAAQTAHRYWDDVQDPQATDDEDTPDWVAELVAALGAVVAAKSALKELRRLALAALETWRHGSSAVDALLAVAAAEYDGEDVVDDAVVQREVYELLQRWLRPGNHHRPPNLISSLLKKLAATRGADTAATTKAHERLRTLLDSASELDVATAVMNTLDDDALRPTALDWLEPRPHLAEWIHDRFQRSATTAGVEGNGEWDTATANKLRGYAKALAHLNYQEALPDLQAARNALAEQRQSQAQQELKRTLDDVITTLERN